MKPKSKKLFQVILVSGTSFSVEAESANIEYSSETGDALSYSFKGLDEKSNYPLYINPKHISAVIEIK